MPQVLAHRGANRRAPENTLEAFRIALALGADGVELDVHASADGVLMVHHAATVRDLGAMGEHPFAAIRSARPDVPTLTEVLDLCTGALLNIEIKSLSASPATGERVASLVVELLTTRGAIDRVVVSSFDVNAVDRVRALDARLPTAVLTPWGSNPVVALAGVADRGHGALHPHAASVWAADPDQVMSDARRLGIALRPWTVNDANEIADFASMGVDAILTDVPELALATLGRGGSG